MTQLGVQYEGANHEGHHNRDVGHHGCIKRDKPRPVSGEIDGENYQGGARGNERDDAQTLPNRVRPKRSKSHSNSVRKFSTDVVDPNVAVLPWSKGPALAASLCLARTISVAFECRRRDESTRRSCSYSPRVRRRDSRTPRRSRVALERARSRRVEL